MATSPILLVLPRLIPGQQIATATGNADAQFVQTINNAFANIASNESALSAQEAMLLDQQTALSSTVAQLQTLTAQMLAILTNRQSATIITTVHISVSATGSA